CIKEVECEWQDVRGEVAEAGEDVGDSDELQPHAQEAAEGHQLDFRLLRVTAEGEQVEERQAQEDVQAKVESGVGGVEARDAADVLAGEVDHRRRDTKPNPEASAIVE